MLHRLWTWMKAEDSRAEGDPRAPWRLFWVAFVIRVLYMTLAHTYRIRPFVDHFQFGWEAGRIARSLATGHGYANPFAPSFMGPTGPTAWVPPAYPMLIAGVFKLFGVYTHASAWVLLFINCILSGFTAMAVWEIAYRCFSRRNAVWSGWLWALYPAAMQYAVRWIWEMTLTTFLFTLVLVLSLRMRKINVGGPDESRRLRIPARRASGFSSGLLGAVIALSTSTLLLFLPICGLWILIGTWNRPHALRNAVLAGIVFLACLMPWEIRNYRVFHAFVPIRGNLGVETYLGNGPGSERLGRWSTIIPTWPRNQLHALQTDGRGAVCEDAWRPGQGLYARASRPLSRQHPQAHLLLLGQRSIGRPLGAGASPASSATASSALRDFSVSRWRCETTSRPPGSSPGSCFCCPCLITRSSCRRGSVILWSPSSPSSLSISSSRPHRARHSTNTDDPDRMTHNSHPSSSPEVPASSAES